MRHVQGQRTHRAEQTPTDRKQRSLNLGEPEARAAGRDDEVAGQHDFEPAPEGEAFDSGDQRLAAGAADDSILATTVRRRARRTGEVRAGGKPRSP